MRTRIHWVERAQFRMQRGRRRRVPAPPRTNRLHRMRGTAIPPDRVAAEQRRLGHDRVVQRTVDLLHVPIPQFVGDNARNAVLRRKDVAHTIVGVRSRCPVANHPAYTQSCAYVARAWRVPCLTLPPQRDHCCWATQRVPLPRGIAWRTGPAFPSGARGFTSAVPQARHSTCSARDGGTPWSVFRAFSSPRTGARNTGTCTS